MFTPGPECTSVSAPVVVSMETNRDSLPGSGDERLMPIVCWAVEQYAMTCRLSFIHFGLPQKSPALVTFFMPDPSGRIK
jgi:hypothetical protein